MLAILHATSDTHQPFCIQLSGPRSHMYQNLKTAAKATGLKLAAVWITFLLMRIWSFVLHILPWPLPGNSSPSVPLSVVVFFAVSCFFIMCVAYYVIHILVSRLICKNIHLSRHVNKKWFVGNDILEYLVLLHFILDYMSTRWIKNFLAYWWQS